ncbi:MAG: dephospho-CoA kinase [Bacteroidales bacterium]|nr:dephospho-CoA kinase [Bacteroidales bacterium]
MKKVGITGGMGCGKSTVVEAFRQLGVSCFVADDVAASYYQDPDFLSEIRSLFGDGVFDFDGRADKRRIAALVFSDKEKLQALNALVHPRVMRDFDAFCRQHEAEDYVLFESAILYDCGLDRLMDRMVCVYLDLAERLRRLQARDGVGEDQIMARIANQMPAEEMMRRADYIILNYEGNPRQRQVHYIDKHLRSNS